MLLVLLFSLLIIHFLVAVDIPVEFSKLIKVQCLVRAKHLTLYAQHDKFHFTFIK